MGKTIVEKILARAASKNIVSPGELVDAEVDAIICHDVTTPPAIKMLEKKEIFGIKNPERIVVTPDHFIPNKDIKSAELNKILLDWAKKNNLSHVFPLGCHGICHAIFPEQGFASPGKIVIGADSHTCTAGAFGSFATGIGSTDLAAAIATGKLWFRVPETIRFNISGKFSPGVFAKDLILEIIKKITVSGALYKSMEFGGEGIKNLDMEERMTICNMAIEAGGKCGIFETDQITEEFCQQSRQNNPNLTPNFLGEIEKISSDADANFEKIIEICLDEIEPIVAFPHLPDNGKKFSEINEMSEIKIDQIFLGSCTNGRFSDLEIAAKILKGKKIAKNVRMIVIPATTEIWKKCLQHGFFEIFSEAGAIISTPTCGACLGGHMGVLAAGEKCLSTTNRNFVGRMGDPKSQVFLSSPATAAASAIYGKISDPREFF